MNKLKTSLAIEKDEDNGWNRGRNRFLIPIKTNQFVTVKLNNGKIVTAEMVKECQRKLNKKL